MTINAWADAARGSPHHQDVEHQRAVDTPELVFEDKIDSNKAASTIASIYNPMLEHGFKFSPVAVLWAIVCEAVRKLGANREIDERPINLINSLSALPDVTDTNDNPISPGNGQNGVY